MIHLTDGTFDLISDLLIVIDEQFTILKLNQAAAKRLDFCDIDLCGRSVALITHPQADLSSDQPQFTDLMDAHGHLIPVELRSTPFRSETVRGRVLVAHDLSERAESEELVRTAFNNSGALLSISRASDGVFIDVNPSFLETLGYTRQEVIGKTSNELGLLASQSQRGPLILEALKTSRIRDLDIQIKTKDGRILEALFNIDVLKIRGETCIMTSAIDITRRKVAEARLVDMLKDLEDLVSRKVNELNQAQLATIIALSNITESRDTDTGHHIERIRALSMILASALAQDPHYAPLLSEPEIANLANASVLHDIGKVGIPDAILLKPGKLTPNEFEVMKHHVIIGWSMLEKLNQRFPDNRYLQLGKEIVLNHHERWDGTGYPHQLKGPAIPLSGQLIAVCDVYDALRSKRPYKPAMDHASTVELMMAQRGSQFNPDVIDAFLAVEHRFDETYNQLAE